MVRALMMEKKCARVDEKYKQRNGDSQKQTKKITEITNLIKKKNVFNGLISRLGFVRNFKTKENNEIFYVLKIKTKTINLEVYIW